MADVLTQFAEPVQAGTGFRYSAQACGAPSTGGLWEGWIEFIPLDGGSLLRTGRETTQPNKVDIQYWATGLSAIYLQGALARALKQPLAREIVLPVPAAFDGPRPDIETTVRLPTIDAVLDPFSVYEKGEKILRQQLGALSSWHLVNIIRAYRFSEEPSAALNMMPAAALIELILSRVSRGRTAKT